MGSAAARAAIPDVSPWRRPPRDAATLIVVDDRGSDVRVLLGRRGDAHVFMPGKFVFPGGRVDAADLKLARSLALDDPLVDRLMTGTTRRFGRARAASVALAGIRETFEEAGLMIGRAATDLPCHDGAEAWGAFGSAGVAPDLSALVPVARAITPPGQVRRYDTRFFCVGIEAVAHRVPFEDRIDRELDSLGWFALDEVQALDLPDITRQVLGDMDDRLRSGAWRDIAGPMPFYRFRNRRLVRDMI